MAIAETFSDNAEFSFPEESLFEKGSVVAPDKATHDPHQHLHTLTLRFRQSDTNLGEVYNLFQILLGNEYTDITTIPKNTPARIIVEGSQRILSNLLTRLEAVKGSPTAADSLGERTGMALGKED